jgi:hypothetical protein
MMLAVDSDIQLHLKCRIIGLAKVSKLRLTAERTIHLNVMNLTHVLKILLPTKSAEQHKGPGKSMHESRRFF